MVVQVSDVQKKPDHRLSFINHNLFSSKLPRCLQQQRFLSFSHSHCCCIFFFPAFTRLESLNLSSHLFPSVNPSCCIKIWEQCDEHPTVQLLPPPLLVAQFYGCLHMVFAFCWRERYVCCLIGENVSGKPEIKPFYWLIDDSWTLWNILTVPETVRLFFLY